MIILALDTTCREASCAVVNDGTILGRVSTDSSHRHAETVLPAVRELLEKHGLTMDKVDAIAVDIGPGSFTGVRIGVTMANAFAFALGKDVYAVNSLEALYEAAGRPMGRCICLVDALNGNAYGAVYENGCCVQQPVAVVTEAFLNQWQDAELIVGDVAGVCTLYKMPEATAVACAALRNPSCAVREAHPMYLRASQAERKAAEAAK